MFGIGVADGSRTRHLRSHNPVLYLMSYGHHLEVLKNRIDQTIPERWKSWSG
jgi:hypothetical protein